MRPVMRAREDVGGQGVAETMAVGSIDLCAAEDRSQHSLGNPG